MSEPSRGGPAPPVWRADEPVDRGWSAPAPVSPVVSPVRSPEMPPEMPPVMPRRRSRWLWLGPVLAVVTVVALVVAFGGFGKRHDTLQRIGVGAAIDTGAFDYTFTRATARQEDDLGKPVYKVIVYGTAQNTTDTGRAPSQSQFAGRDLVDPDARYASGLKTGSSSDYTVGSTLNPGLPPVVFQVEFDFPQDWRPSNTFRIAASTMVEEQYFLNQEQANWQNGDTGFQVYVPMQTLAPKRS